MSISMEPFASEGHFATYNPIPRVQNKVSMFTLACRSCGYEPQDIVVAPAICPKCHGNGWERFARPGSILENAHLH